ncbi:hypothetical protein MLD38_031813 [Melastoma candidum]|uniref:Uncharacterized protein n=1 Tax=Melastoma candidum TaxID=119954 RepID=A0ACB9MQU8_9MYRT|nr:hypothetical protein MLD38_031813 [Melastoma candidum]
MRLGSNSLSSIRARTPFHSSNQACKLDVPRKSRRRSAEEFLAASYMRYRLASEIDLPVSRHSKLLKINIKHAIYLTVPTLSSKLTPRQENWARRSQHLGKIIGPEEAQPLSKRNGPEEAQSLGKRNRPEEAQHLGK